MSLIAKRCRNDETVVCLGWVMSHIGIGGNEGADEEGRRRRRGRIGRGHEGREPERREREGRVQDSNHRRRSETESVCP